MKKSISLFVALLLLTSGWAGAFLLANNPSANQSYWLLPALIIGMGIGLCLRFINGKRTALLLALTAALGLGAVNNFFPGSRVSFESVRSLFSGENPQGNLRQVKVDQRFQTAPFDRPLVLTSPVSLGLSLFTRLPAGVDDFCFSPEGSLYASLPSLGAVYRIEQPSAEGLNRPELFLHSLDNPTGLACDTTQLLVAEVSQIKAHPYSGARGELLVEGLPNDGGEVAHRLQRLPEGLLFSIGSRCDACREKDPLRATLQLLDANGQLQPYGRGLRKLGGLALSERDGSLWASEQSRIYPAPGAADELNRLRAGGDYGWPVCEGEAPGFAPQDKCQGIRGAELLLQNRANPAGLMETAGLNFPLVYRSSLLMVLQGDSDYNIVPAVVRLQVTEGKVGAPVAFLGGWDGKTARPSAIHAGPDGAVFIADEINGAIYKAEWLGGS